MSEFIGSHISLISKSNIRYSGTLHDINSEESTVSLENVKSFGTEGREESPDKFIAPNDEIYDYIKFRGTDVKDLRIEKQKPAAPAPAPPNDPAILGAHRPDSQNPGHGSQRLPQPGVAGAAMGPGGPGAPGVPGYPYPYYGAGPGWGRGGPMPGPSGYPGMSYPQNWGPGGPGAPAAFPPGPGGPGTWNHYQYPPGMSAIPTGPAGPGRPNPMNGIPSAQAPKGQAPGPAALNDQAAASEKKSAPAPPTSQPAAHPATQPKPAVHTLAQPQANAARAAPITPAVPIYQEQAPTPKFQPPVSKTEPSQSKPAAAAPSEASIIDTTEAAKAAVALAMSKINAGQSAVPSSAPVDNLSRRVNDMRINATHRGHQGPRHHRGSGRPYQQFHKIEVPDEDFDFASANAKFMKQDIANVADQPAPVESEKTDEAGKPRAYNKSTSFFDNISSEAKDRAENGGQKPGGREWRGEEQRKNVETFGQGSVDGGYRNYRGRGRGRGGYRGGRGRGGQHGGYQNRLPRHHHEN